MTPATAFGECRRRHPEAPLWARSPFVRGYEALRPSTWLVTSCSDGRNLGRSATFSRHCAEMRLATLLLNRHSECRKSRQHLWLVNADYIAARTRGTGGDTSYSR